MAAAAQQQPQQILEQAMQRNELAKLPIWFGEPSKDAFRAEDWWARFEGAAAAAGWNWEQTSHYFMQALRGPALKWWTLVQKNYPPDDVDDLGRIFLQDYGQTAAARPSITHLRIVQKPTQLVRDYASDVQAAVDTLELSVPAMPVIPYPDLLRNYPDGVAAIGVAHVQWLRGEINRHVMSGYNRFKQPIIRNFFIDGLLPHIRQEVIRQNPNTLVGAINAARQAEKNAALQQNLSKANNQIEEVGVEALYRQ
jgi:hypothetical protein